VEYKVVVPVIVMIDVYMLCFDSVCFYIIRTLRG